MSPIFLFLCSLNHKKIIWFMCLGVDILKPKTEPEPEPSLNRPNYWSIRVFGLFLNILYFGVWVRFLTFKTRIDRITRNIKKLLICDGIII
jgi:hypothetical protein